jgi:mevalonate kinase
VTVAPASGHAFGKVILLGEHAVVHGHPALAGALARGVTAEVTLGGSGPSRLEVAGWDLTCTTDDDTPLAAALRALLAAAGVDTAARVHAQATLPAGAGLGSSAALAVAVARALIRAKGEVAPPAAVEAIANAAERVFHDNPSGIDVALASRGGLGLYRRGLGLERLDAPPLVLAVGLSGEPRTTAAMVRRVADRLDANRPALARLGEAATAGAEAARAGDLGALGALFRAAHRDLAAIGVSTPGLEALVALATGAGALGAKLTGAGGGGAVIAIAPGREQLVVDAWRAAGYEAFACAVGQPAADVPSPGATI